jgi:hypothetical protein
MKVLNFTIAHLVFKATSSEKRFLRKKLSVGIFSITSHGMWGSRDELGVFLSGFNCDKAWASN